AEHLFEECLATVEITGENPGEPLEQRGRRFHDVLFCEPSRRLISVRTHPVDTVPAQAGPHQGRPRLGITVTGLARVPVLPAIDHLRPPLGLAAPPHLPGHT